MFTNQIVGVGGDGDGDEGIAVVRNRDGNDCGRTEKATYPEWVNLLEGREFDCPSIVHQKQSNRCPSLG